MLSLWRRGQATIPEIDEDLARRGDTFAYTTILTLLQRLRAKGFVEATRLSPSTTAYGYAPAIDFEPAVRQAFERFLREYQFDAAGLEILRTTLEESHARAPSRRAAHRKGTAAGSQRPRSQRT